MFPWRRAGANTTWTYDVRSGDWGTSPNWTNGSMGGIPAAGDDAQVTGIFSEGKFLVGGSIVTFDGGYSTSDPLNDLLIDGLFGENVDQSSYTLSANSEEVAYSYSGEYTQSGGTNNVGTLGIGLGSGSSGGYQISGAASLNVVDLEVGCNLNGDASGTGTFLQDGGSVSVSSVLLMGSLNSPTSSNPVGTGTYTLESGSLQVGSISPSSPEGGLGIGYVGPGTFIQTGGTATFSQLAVYNGSYSLSGAASLVVIDGEIIGQNSTDPGVGATFNQSGGTHLVMDEFNDYGLDIGSDRAGTYNLSDGSLSTGGAYSMEVIGYGGGTGTFNQSGGTNTTATMFLGTDFKGLGSSSGSYSLSDGTCTVGTMFIAENGSGPDGDGTLGISGGTMTVTGALQTDGTATLSAGTFNITTLVNGGDLSVSGGTLWVSASTSNGGAIQQSGGSASLGPVTGNGTIILNATAGSTATMTVSSIAQASLSISAGAGGNAFVQIGSNSSPVTNSLEILSIGSNGTLDITNNTLLINYGLGQVADPIASVEAWIESGYNGGAWNGPGIISSTAQSLTNGLRYGVGWADSADGVVSGLSSGQIEIKYTLLGDANLDGTVNGSDFSILAANFGLGATNWDQGNFLYGSSVNGSDFSALAANFGQGDSGADASVSQSDIVALDAFAVANGLPLPTIGSVPEPAAAGLVVLSTICCLARRRKTLVRPKAVSSFGMVSNQ